jgi:hypothetical protein
VPEKRASPCQGLLEQLPSPRHPLNLITGENSSIIVAGSG